MHNKDLVILAIFSIVSLLLLHRRFGKEKVILQSKATKVKVEPYVRHNPTPIFDPVMNYDAKYYETIPMKQKKTINVVLCYADWCHNCHRILPIFAQLRDINSLHNVKYIMAEEQNKDYSKYLNAIKHYPTILIEVNDKISQYNGSMSKTDIINYVNNI